MTSTGFTPPPLTRKDRREISEFVARQFFFDHVRGELDPIREQAFAACVARYPALWEELGRFREAVAYAESLGSIRIPPHLAETLRAPDNYLSIILKRTNFERWPLPMRWGIEAAIVLAIFLTVVMVAPWSRMFRSALSPDLRQVILAEAPHVKRQMEIAETPLFEPQPTGDEVAAVAQPPSSTVSADVAPLPASPMTTTGPVPSPPAAGGAPNGPGTAAPAPSQATTAGSSATTAERRAGAGFLYRGGLEVQNLMMVGPRIRDKIVELGGKKAGEVELGWQKSAASAYFHFTLPEDKFEELNLFLSDYGTPVLNRENHPRVMRKGLIRLIITVEEARR